MVNFTKGEKMVNVKAVSWWSDEHPEIEDLLMELNDKNDVSEEFKTLDEYSDANPCYLVWIKAREGDNAHDFNFGQIREGGVFDCEFSLTRIKTVHGKKYPLNCMTDKKTAKQLQEILNNLSDKDKLVKISGEIFDQIVDIRPR